MDSKKIIAKLIKIAQNQQKIIEKLAQQSDPNIDYLRSAVQIAVVNTGFKARTFYVTKSEGTGAAAPGNKVTSSPAGYIVSMEGSPENNNLRQKFVDVLRKQIATQKPDQPELVDNLSVLFN